LCGKMAATHEKGPRAAPGALRAHISFRAGRKYLPHDTFGHFISGLSASIRFRSFLHQALVMKATRTAPVDKLVVVIDDDPLILEATGGLLQSWGCCVVTAQSCEEALGRIDQVTRDEPAPHLSFHAE
jgi:hypothetical protein